MREGWRKRFEEGEEIVKVVHVLFPFDVVAGGFGVAAFAGVVLGDGGFDHGDEMPGHKATGDVEAATAGFGDERFAGGDVGCGCDI